jgi:hypothetical protein
MERLRNRFLNVPVDAVVHPASKSAQHIAKEQKDKATMALGDEQHKPDDRRTSQLSEMQATTLARNASGTTAPSRKRRSAPPRVAKAKEKRALDFSSVDERKRVS